MKELINVKLLYCGVSFSGLNITVPVKPSCPVQLIQVDSRFRLWILLLGHGREDLLHLIDDAIQLVWVPLDDLLNGVAHRRLTTKECTVSQQVYHHGNHC